MNERIRKILDWLNCKLTNTHRKDYACLICGFKCACGKRHHSLKKHAEYTKDKIIFDTLNK